MKTRIAITMLCLVCALGLKSVSIEAEILEYDLPELTGTYYPDPTVRVVYIEYDGEPVEITGFNIRVKGEGGGSVVRCPTGADWVRHLFFGTRYGIGQLHHFADIEQCALGYPRREFICGDFWISKSYWNDTQILEPGDSLRVLLYNQPWPLDPPCYEITQPPQATVNGVTLQVEVQSQVGVEQARWGKIKALYKTDL